MVRYRSLFLGLVFFLVLFGGGGRGHWTVVCRDLDGWIYEIDRDSIRWLGPSEVQLKVRYHKERQYFSHHWLLELSENTLVLDDGASQPIARGSAAAQVVVYLKGLKLAGVVHE